MSTSATDTKAQFRAAVGDLCAEGMSRHEAVAFLLGEDPSEMPAARVLTEGEPVYSGPRVREMVAVPIPEHMIPTEARLRDKFDIACKNEGVTADELSEFKPGFPRYRISRFWKEGDASTAPLRMLENSAKAMARAGIFPAAPPVVGLGVTGKVQYDEEQAGKQIFDLLSDLRLGKLDDSVLVVEKLDRIVRTSSLGSILIHECRDHRCDIFEFATDLDVRPIEKNWKSYISDFASAEEEIDRLVGRVLRDRQFRINSGVLAGGAGTIAHLTTQVRAKNGRVKISELPANPEYVPLVESILERVAAGEAPNAIAVELDGLATRGEGLYPSWRRDGDGELVPSRWRSDRITTLVRSLSLIGCQENDAGERIPCPQIARIVSDELFDRANATLDRNQAARKAAAEERGEEDNGEERGPVRKRIGVPIVVCEGCEGTARGGQNRTIICGKPHLIGVSREAASVADGTAADGVRHFKLPEHAYLPMLREVSLGMLESRPEIEEAANARQVETDTTQEQLKVERRKQAALSAQRQRIRASFTFVDLDDPEATPEIEQDEYTALMTENAAKSEQVAEAIDKLHSTGTTMKAKRHPGKTWRESWAIEEAKPNREGSVWINDLLSDLFKQVRVKVGPEYKGARNTFHEGRLTFVPQEGYICPPELVAETAKRLYTARLATIRDGGNGQVEQFISDEAWRIHHDERLGTTTVLRRLNALVAADPKWQVPKPKTAGRLASWTGLWTIMKVDKLVREEYARRGVEFVANTKLHISDQNRGLMRDMVARHGEQETLALFNGTMGWTNDQGQPLTLCSLRAAIKCGNGKPGRKPTLTEAHLDVAEAMQNTGKTIREIRLALATRPVPCFVCESHLSRKLVARRKGRTVS